MAISDLFSSSFLFSIAIIIVLIGGIFAFVSYRMAEQDHKLSSMVGLVSVLAQDLQFVKNKVNLLQNNNNSETEKNEINLDNQIKIIGGNGSSELISVSDEEIDDNDEENSDEENSDDENSDDENSDGENSDDENSDDENSDDEEDENEAHGINSQDQIKLLNLTLVNEEVENDSPIEDLQCEFEELVQNNNNNSNNIIKTIHLENPISIEDTEITLENEDESKLTNNDINFLKNVSINDLGEGDESHTNKSEYKKMSINKLREVAVTKGVISDASKLKKQEILKLLGDE